MSQPPAGVKVVECPRDAMQGLHDFVPTARKVAYVQALLDVGFDTLDVGSFVSPKAIPQMADTAEVLRRLDLSTTRTRLLTIVANARGARQAAATAQVDDLGYPFSVSETFQLRNTNADLRESLGRLRDIHELCRAHGKGLVVYLSMGFGNPYGDPWNVRVVAEWVERLATLGMRTLQLSDTIGVSTPDSIEYLFSELLPAYPEVEIGAHLHTTPTTWYEKVDAAYRSGCRRFDGALRGYGGCPMAADELTGNMPTENLLSYLSGAAGVSVDPAALQRAATLLPTVFPER